MAVVEGVGVWISRRFDIGTRERIASAGGLYHTKRDQTTLGSTLSVTIPDGRVYVFDALRQLQDGVSDGYVNIQSYGTGSQLISVFHEPELVFGANVLARATSELPLAVEGYSRLIMGRQFVSLTSDRYWSYWDFDKSRFHDIYG